MNDARRPALGTRSRCPEHIYAHLHGTGGIGPETWKRHGLAEAQEAHAQRKRLRALNLVRVVTVGFQEGHGWTAIIDAVTKLL